MKNFISFIIIIIFYFRKLIIKLIKSDYNEKLSSKNMQIDLKKRLDYIIQLITDSKYYIQLLTKIKAKKNEISRIENTKINNDKNNKEIENLCIYQQNYQQSTTENSINKKLNISTSINNIRIKKKKFKLRRKE